MKCNIPAFLKALREYWLFHSDVDFVKDGYFCADAHKTKCFKIFVSFSFVILQGQCDVARV